MSGMRPRPFLSSSLASFIGGYSRLSARSGEAKRFCSASGSALSECANLGGAQGSLALYEPPRRACGGSERSIVGELPFDSAICRLGLMLIPEPHTVLQAILRLLRPGGHLGVVMFSSPAANPFMSEPLRILRRHANKPIPPAGNPGIFALSDATEFKALLTNAGFVDVDIRTIEAPLAMTSATQAVQMMQDAFGVYRAIISDQPPEAQKAAWTEVLNFLKGFEGSDGFRIPAQVNVAGAAKPN